MRKCFLPPSIEEAPFLTVQHKKIPVLNEEGFHLPMPSQFPEMIENEVKFQVPCMYSTGTLGKLAMDWWRSLVSGGSMDVHYSLVNMMTSQNVTGLNSVDRHGSTLLVNQLDVGRFNEFLLVLEHK